MLNYRKGKKRIKVNGYGSLYIDYQKIKDKRPIIYIGGQMEHRLHILEQTGMTFDQGHNMFDGSWFYDYPIHPKDKSQFDVINFGENLIATLQQANLGEVDIIGESYGGIIGAYATKSPLIHKVLAIHPPILGTPLANKDLISYAIKELEFEQKWIARLVNIIVNTNYGFEQDNALGIYNPKLQDVADISKLIVASSSLNPDTEKNKIAKLLYDLIWQLTHKTSDGVLIYDAEELTKLGIPFIEDDEPLCHFDAGSKENIEKCYKKTLKNITN